jgi:hypothetical protein
MDPEASRVVYDNRPYLVLRREDGSLERAYGPFAPGTEPNVAECTDENEVRNEALLRTLEQLVPVSPSIPNAEDTLAGTV